MNEQPEMIPLDTSDIAKWVGVPIGGRQPKEPFSVNDIRRFVEAVDFPHRLHWDDDYAASSPYGGVVAPQSYVGGGQGGTGPTPAIQGRLPDSHLLVGGDEQWFYGPRVYPGDRLRCDAVMFDFRETSTKFAGPTVIARGDLTYVNQNGHFIMKQRATSVRYLVENARRIGILDELSEEPTWTDEQLEELDRAKLEWASSLTGSRKKLWDSVKVGDPLPVRPLGPHSVSTFTSQSRSEQAPAAWGATEYSPPFPNSYEDAGWLSEMDADDPSRLEHNPGFADPLTRGPSKGHVSKDLARVVGIPRAYGYGAIILAWTVDYLSGWAGDWGFVRHHKTSYRAPVLAGDVGYFRGEVVDSWISEPFQRGVVQVAYTMTSQTGAVIATGKAEIELPRTESDLGALADDPRVMELLRTKK